MTSEADGNLVYAQCSKGQGFTGLGVDQQDFSVQDHAVTSGERLRDVVLEVRHLKRHMRDLKRKVNKRNSVCIIFSRHKNPRKVCWMSLGLIKSQSEMGHSRAEPARV